MTPLALSPGNSIPICTTLVNEGVAIRFPDESKSKVVSMLSRMEKGRESRDIAQQSRWSLARPILFLLWQPLPSSPQPLSFTIE
jgi:hypothetical protein